jgi:hypothetical protein
MDSDHHTDEHNCYFHAHRDAPDRYSNGYQYSHTDFDLNLYDHTNADALVYIFADLHAIVDIYCHPDQPANGHFHAILHTSADVYPYAIHYTFPVTNNACLPLT